MYWNFLNGIVGISSIEKKRKDNGRNIGIFWKSWMFCCSIGMTRQIQQPRMTGQEGHDKACARTRTRTAASREVAVSGTASTAAAVEEQQP